LNELWSDRLIKILIAIQSKLHIRQEVLYGDIQRFYYDLGNMNRLTLKIKEDIEFQRWMIVKLKSEKIPVWKLS
jgi:hypothetical protein